SLVAFRASLEPIISELLQRAARPALDHADVFVGRLHPRSRLPVEKGRPERSIVEYWKDQLRRVFGIVMDGVGAMFVRAIDVAEQEVRYGRVGTGNLEPNAAAFGEAPGVRQQRDFELVNLFRLERRPLGMGVDGNVVGADPAVALAVMRGAQPTLGDDAVARLDALGAVLGRLSELLGHLDDDVHVVAGRR